MSVHKRYMWIYQVQTNFSMQTLLLLMYTVAIWTMLKKISERDLAEFAKLRTRNYFFNNKATKKNVIYGFFHTYKWNTYATIVLNTKLSTNLCRKNTFTLFCESASRHLSGFGELYDKAIKGLTCLLKSCWAEIYLKINSLYWFMGHACWWKVPFKNKSCIFLGVKWVLAFIWR